MTAGTVVRINGPVVDVTGLETAMLDLVEVGTARLPGEVIGIDSDVTTVQVYEYTGGMRPGEPARSTGLPLAAELGPGLIGGVFDGMLRRLRGAADMLEPGARTGTLSPEQRWSFTPDVKAGDELTGGAVIGRLPETTAVEFRALVPPGVAGTVEWVAAEGKVGVGETIARVGGQDLTLRQLWPVRRPRPVAERRRAVAPLITGQRVLDLFFPVALGSSAAIPGGFGTGKTVLLQQIAKWCDATVIVYVGCGERGNEMADVLGELSALIDPRTGTSLLDRTVLIANTSNMPVLAREASIYTGATVAEFYRDMGYDVVLVADSTSRWAEALREVASRTGELPAEEGYPAGLASALAAFYERAGRVRTLGGDEASVTILGAVSPPGGDMTEPVSAHTRRFVRCTWSLDPDLAYARHYPAIRWQDSSSRDVEPIASWRTLEGDPDWARRREEGLRLLAEADRLEAIAELVGAATLPDEERLVLWSARLLREGVLQQNSMSANDTYSAVSKQEALLELVLGIHAECKRLLGRGVSFSTVQQADLSAVTQVRDAAPPDGAQEVRDVATRVFRLLGSLA